MSHIDPYNMRKYPRTPHIEGSRLQPGDEDLSQIPFENIRGRRIVVEEKCDGANSGISFDGEGNLLLQSRGHYLIGGGRERHYNLFKQWANHHIDALFGVLGNRYILYGEWMYAKHTVFYDALSHYFLEFDIYDRETDRFLDTPSRAALRGTLPIAPVPVLADAAFDSLAQLTGLIGQSKFIREGHHERLRAYCERSGEQTEIRLAETDPSTLMEGLYIKLEGGGEVLERMKFVRSGFLQYVDQSNSHWLSRSIVPNQLRRPLDVLFAPTLPEVE